MNSSNFPSAPDGTEILDGEAQQDVVVRHTQLGYEIAAYTDRGGRATKVNQDRIGIHPDLDFCIVADGMGGEQSGDMAAHAVTAAFLADPHNLRDAAAYAREHNMPEYGGTCVMTSRIYRPAEGADILFPEQAGDCRLSIANCLGEITYVTDDQNLAALIEGGSRNILYNAIYGKRVHDENEHKIKQHHGLNFPEDHVAILTSDGIHDYCDMDTLAHIIQEADNLREGIHHIIALTADTKDNRAIAVIRRKKD